MNGTSNDQLRAKVRAAFKRAILKNFDQVQHQGLFLDGYYYRPVSQEALSLAIEDAVEEICNRSAPEPNLTNGLL